MTPAPHGQPSTPPTSDAETFAWLPDHQTHVLESLGHIDDQLHAVAVLLQDYSRDGAFDLREEVDGSQVRVIVERVQPIPAAVSRGAADILNALRNLLEHVVYAEVEHALGRPLDEAESRALEMPVADTSSNFDKWLNHKWRRDLPLLGRDGILAQKLRALQPFEWTVDGTAPLRLLADYTNATKHRKPAAVAVLVGKVVADYEISGLSVLSPVGEPAQVGDVIVTAPRSPRVGVDVWPLIAIRRAPTGWRVLVPELAHLEQWVRETAVPLLLGLSEGQDLPAATNVLVGNDDMRSAAAAATDAPAAIRNLQKLTAEGVILPGFRDILHRACTSDTERRAVDGWLESLSDADLIRRWERFVATRGDLERYSTAAGQLVRIASRWALDRQGPADAPPHA